MLSVFGDNIGGANRSCVPDRRIMASASSTSEGWGLMGNDALRTCTGRRFWCWGWWVLFAGWLGVCFLLAIWKIVKKRWKLIVVKSGYAGNAQIRNSHRSLPQFWTQPIFLYCWPDLPVLPSHTAIQMQGNMGNQGSTMRCRDAASLSPPLPPPRRLPFQKRWFVQMFVC